MVAHILYLIGSIFYGETDAAMKGKFLPWATTTENIAQFFQAILQRAPTDTESALFVGLIDDGQLSLTAAQMTIINLTETSDFVDPVIRIYQAAFGRMPDQGGLVFIINSEAAVTQFLLSAAQGTQTFGGPLLLDPGAPPTNVTGDGTDNRSRCSWLDLWLVLGRETTKGLVSRDCQCSFGYQFFCDKIMSQSANPTPATKINPQPQQVSGFCRF